MIASFEHNEEVWKVDLSKPLDISIPLESGQIGPNCFYAPLYESYPVKTDNFIGDTRKGGVVNFFNIKINPHGNGTHTECVGHISEERILLRESLKEYHYAANLISIKPTKIANGDFVIGINEVKEATKDMELTPAIILRTLPNNFKKLNKVYSGTNPTYFDPKAIEYLIDSGTEHLLTDLPSVDREEDEGLLLSHKKFWGFPNKIAVHRTITELIFVDDKIEDGRYLLNLQIGSYDLDVSPSRPILFRLL